MERIKDVAGPALIAECSPGTPRRRHTIDKLVEVFPALKRRIIESDHDANNQMASVTPHQADALCVLSREGALSMNDLARNLNIALSTASALADRLLKQGQVERIHGPGDRRVVRLGLTAGAADTVQRHLAGRRAGFMRALEVLSDAELDALLELLTKVVAGSAVPAARA